MRKHHLRSVGFWEAELHRLIARIEKLKLAERGQAKVTTTRVKGHYVPRHWVSAHPRTVITVPRSRRTEQRTNKKAV